MGKHRDGGRILSLLWLFATPALLEVEGEHPTNHIKVTIIIIH
jgi:hypothetical protein